MRQLLLRSVSVNVRRYRGFHCASFHSSSTTCPGEDTTTDDDGGDFLVKLRSARLSTPGSFVPITSKFDLTIKPAVAGGHAILGRNGSGKSLLSNVLIGGDENVADEDSDSTDKNVPKAPIHDGELFHANGCSPSRSISHVSFESHQSLLDQGGTVYAALTPHGGRLSKAAEFLIVRFGLYPFLHRDVHTLSTGEIRKVLLVRALSTRPQLLVLDNAFDGLDVPSRAALGDLVSKTLRGFRPDILVQGVSSKNTAHTQIVLITHRAEEIVDEVTTVSMLGYENEKDNLQQPQVALRTEMRNGRTGDQLLRTAFLKEECKDEATMESYDLLIWDWNDASLPSMEQIRSLWESGQHRADDSVSVGAMSPIVKATKLHVCRGETTLLDGLDWIVHPGERWLVAGGNGAGKSTLSRLLAKEEERQEGFSEGTLHVSIDASAQQRGVGWVSTEFHMGLTQSKKIAREILLGADSNVPPPTPPSSASFEPYPSDVGIAIARWLDLDESLLSKPFRELSQGQQKLLLIGRALASRPHLLILDEPCQGLDLLHRRRVLGLIERVCQSTNTTLIYITHHLEELIPSVTHVLHLKDRKASYSGVRTEYNPKHH